MKNIIIVGYNSFSKKVIDCIKNVSVILDDLTRENSYNNIKIDNIKNVSNYLENNTEIYVIDDMPYFDELYHKLYDVGINKINVIIKENIDIVDENILSSKFVQTYYLKDKPLLRYIETHICDKCNLKCNGCTHFSNISDIDNVSIESFKKDLDELESKFDVSMIRLMGGEPFLKNNLDEYINYTRKKFPKATIFIVTNGLLIRNMSDKNINSIRDNNIIINISLYKPTLRIINDIKLFLNNNKIKCRFGRGNIEPLECDYILNFHTCLSTNKINNNEKLTCYNQYCWFLRNGCIYKCPYPAFIHILNSKYNTEFKVLENDSFKLSKVDDGWDTIKKLSDRISFCDYCRNNVKNYEWNNRLPELSYYILGGKNGDIKD